MFEVMKNLLSLNYEHECVSELTYLCVGSFKKPKKEAPGFHSSSANARERKSERNRVIFSC